MWYDGNYEKIEKEPLDPDEKGDFTDSVGFWHINKGFRGKVKRDDIPRGRTSEGLIP